MHLIYFNYILTIISGLLPSFPQLPNATFMEHLWFIGEKFLQMCFYNPLVNEDFPVQSILHRPDKW